MELLNRHRNDILSEWLRAVTVHSTVYCLSDLRAPWGFQVEDSPSAKFHLVLEGACVLKPDGGDALMLDRGELVLLPHGTGHVVRDQADSPILSLERILADDLVDDEEPRLVYGGRGRLTRLLCGGFTLDGALPDGLLRLLPEVLKLDADARGSSRWLQPVFALLREEADESRPGAAAVLTKIADVFLAEILRGYLAAAEEAGLVHLSSLRDPAIARALELIHRQPHWPWSVAGLAREVGMSRTLFAARFRALTGEPPIRYVTRVRLSQAAGNLMTTNAKMYVIASRAGYESEASFSKAFKRAFGRPPSDYRRGHLASPITIWEQPS